MQIYTRLILCAMLTSSATTVLGQSNPFSNFTFEGEIGFGAVSETDTLHGFQYGNFSINVGRGPLGFEAGMFGFVGRRHETYGALTWTQNGKFSFGFPRPAYDLHAQSFFLDTIPRLSLDHVHSSLSRATYGAMYEPEFLPYGVNYQRQNGPLSYAISAHGVPGTDIAVFGGGLSYEINNWVLAAAAEAISEDGEISLSHKATAQVTLDDVTAGVGYFDPSIDTATIEAFATYALADSFSVTALYAASTDAAQPDRVGVSASVAITQALRADVGATKYADAEPDFSLALIWSF